MTFWDTPTFHEYERLCGDEPGTRTRILADATWQTRVVDLSKPDAELWCVVRKSYKSLIRQSERTGAIRIGRTGVDLGIAAALHAVEAGRQTRLLETWELMRIWIDNRHGLLVMGADAFAYFVVFEAWAYYFSSAALQGSLHGLIWRGLMELKARGVRWAELGWQGEAKDAKGKQIEFFKRGLGGFDLPANEAPKLCA